MFIDEVLRLLPAPAMPFAGDRAWSDLEAELGTALPELFKCFLDRYGPGLIDDYIRFYHPLGVELNLTREIQERTAFYREIWREFDIPLSAGAGIGDVLYWGNTKFGVVLFFRISDPDPNVWTVLEQADDEYEDSGLTFEDWLFRYLRGGGSAGHYIKNRDAVEFRPIRPTFYRVEP